ncbi:hypothetical protein NUU61_002129 [Penicillium alfredii]|uniref:ATP-grasp domain-containing protein n=1 Tax=Penicillium alfredii TaxID=1506179 RepID=A0A9W9FRN2_9EURO|nr:uncharacterized protein NUU61_002129 [Penicillium alfredii]KAJ5104782.1 hypothetical protein NUU61_002129 [Penicillium alfredii]
MAVRAVGQRLGMRSIGPISTQALTRVAWHLCRIFVSLSLLWVDNTILLIVGCLARLRRIVSRRQATLRNVRFYPKSVLVTGIGTPSGLALARAWEAEGHRVVGADVADLDLPVRSGGSMSKTLVAFYRVPKDHYISRLLDIIHREKVDVWIPCSPKANVIEDATARQVIESRTNCKCITFDVELTACFVQPESFRRWVAERDLPVVERHQVQSRDSVHKILHRSPTKSYQMRRLGFDESAVILPKRTLSKTYTRVSEIQISKDRPWVLQQQPRLGEFIADLLVVRGHVHAIGIRPAGARSSQFGSSLLDEALAMAIHRLMQRFAMAGGVRMTGHLSVRLMVDQEFDAHSVRHAIHIAGCTPGAEVIEYLFDNTPHSVAGYLAVLSSDPVETAAWPANVTRSSTSRPTLAWAEQARAFPLLSSIAPWILLPQAIRVLRVEITPFLFWKDPRFSPADPLPWWWHVHVYQPLREVWLLMKQNRESGLVG